MRIKDEKFQFQHSNHFHKLRTFNTNPKGLIHFFENEGNFAKSITPKE